MLSKVCIGELWATPRLWREYNDPGARCALIRPNGRAFVAHTAADCDNVERESLAKYRGSVGDRRNPPTACFSLATMELQDRMGARSRVGRDGGEGGVRPEAALLHKVALALISGWRMQTMERRFNSTSLLHRLGFWPHVKADVLIGGATES